MKVMCKIRHPNVMAIILKKVSFFSNVIINNV